MELVKLTSLEFRQIAKVVYEKTGIHLPETKLTLLSNRLRKRVRALKLENFKAYYDLLKDSKRCEEELPHFLSAVTTNETYFFRNEALWKFFRETWLPEVVARKKKNRSASIRVWSAASSSGEEAFTAAICLREELPDFSRWSVQIVASDISQDVLDRARLGRFTEYSVARLPKKYITKWFDQEEDAYVIKRELCKMVSFRFHNLRDPFPNANFDLVFLRNVLMYFDTSMKVRVLANVSNALVPGGRLVVGDVDPIRNCSTLSAAMTLEYRGPNVYQKPAFDRPLAATAPKG